MNQLTGNGLTVEREAAPAVKSRCGVGGAAVAWVTIRKGNRWSAVSLSDFDECLSVDPLRENPQYPRLRRGVRKCSRIGVPRAAGAGGQGVRALACRLPASPRLQGPGR